MSLTGVFSTPLRDTPWPSGPHKNRPCRVCGKSWFPWAGSMLNCHARCLFTPGAAAIIKTDPRPQRLIAEHYGVMPSVIRAIHRAG